MKYYVEKILKTELFKDFSESEVIEFFEHYEYSYKAYQKGEKIYSPEDIIKSAGIILSGQVNVVQFTSIGREQIVSAKSAGEIIGQAFSITGQHNSFAYFIAAAQTELLYLDLHRIIASPISDHYFQKFINNITLILASTCIKLNKKIQLLTQKTLREKLMAFFSQMALTSGSTSFKIDFTREELASYVCSERSSVCRELGKMQDDGLVEICGNQITIRSALEI